ncbi:hypothetical protein CHS0354_005309 [Potamilus streckersoni]|uniref:Poly(A) RNA polymerase, mitochondrial n=1 Tax=Potamilus streckersoni TaxID=2493646 RepID=A0AAE0VVE1_9BIVA|nr:hypothetical protein CHS0354_005309 [Potamilus streckersoni]
MATCIGSMRNLLCRRSFKLILPRFLISRRCFSELSMFKDAVPFKVLQKIRQQQADNSVLITLNEKSCPVALYNFCEKYGKINYSAFNYPPGGKPRMLVEFSTHEELEALLDDVTSFQEDPLLWHTRHVHWAYSNHSSQSTSRDPFIRQMSQVLKLTELLECKSITDQINLIYKTMRMSELENRYHYLLCSFVQELVRPLFPSCSILPFGSGVNGLGLPGCDVDMTLDLNIQPPSNTGKNGKTKLKYMSKSYKNNERQMEQDVVNLMSHLVNLLPTVSNCVRIPHARVPILKFHHGSLDKECDLSILNISGLKMTELLCTYGELDARFRPLIYAVKMWAHECGVTVVQRPSPYPSNFTLIMLVIFFLQTRKNPILPSINKLCNLAGKEDNLVIIQDDKRICTDPKKIKMRKNTQDLGDLFVKFFEFYSTFDFQNNSISVISGKSCPKVELDEFSPMQIENPFESDHNVSKNVDPLRLKKLQQAFIEALEKLHNSANKTDSLWGILSIFNKSFTPDTILYQSTVKLGGLQSLESKNDAIREESNKLTSKVVSEVNIESKTEEQCNGSTPGLQEEVKKTGSSVNVHQLFEEEDEINFGTDVKQTIKIMNKKQNLVTEEKDNGYSEVLEHVEKTTTTTGTDQISVNSIEYEDDVWRNKHSKKSVDEKLKIDDPAVKSSLAEKRHKLIDVSDFLKADDASKKTSISSSPAVAFKSSERVLMKEKVIDLSNDKPDIASDKKYVSKEASERAQEEIFNTNEKLIAKSASKKKRTSKKMDKSVDVSDFYSNKEDSV